ncbi:hypothetical protein BFP70_05280 [Thioclava sp. SK-1]|uniref:M10 family metallopeptidase C-terminal domain-containing protein n=1 Tax=Thioclava sp. SK-1 TaxID=1889770 RepID=UPI000823FE1C|nr:M10 family metallopeptidase C-terminal domain-containing protein [Thioclava sp. SK-1]OCX66434.1 hypothetical protein BFP70_05280 [Thioclava sp. SK-1]
MCTECSNPDHIIGINLTSLGLGGTSANDKPDWSISEIAEFLRVGYWAGKGTSAHSFILSQDGSLSVNLTGLTQDAQDTAREALQAWTTTTGLRFVETRGAAQITIDDDSSGAWSNALFSGTVTQSAHVNVAADFSSGAYRLQTFIHEIGHALGLGHAGQYNAAGNYASDASYANDSWQYSIMSYFTQAQNTETTASFAFVRTPQIADVLAIQQIYGTGAQVQPGDTIYGRADIIATRAQTIADGGGEDMIDLRGRDEDQRLDMKSGAFSDIDGRQMNLAIAVGTVIENAASGAGNDSINGNGADNQIDAGAGADMVWGGAGGDLLSGGAGDDSLWGQDGNDTLDGGAGDNLLNGGTGWDTAQFNADAADVLIFRHTDSLQVKTDSGIDTLTDIEALSFTDGTAAADNFDAALGQGWVSAADFLDGAQTVLPSTPAAVVTPPAAALPDAPVSAPTADVRMEVGTLQLSRAVQDDGWIHVTFARAITDAVVVVGPLSIRGTQPLVPELRNITDTGFDLRISEWEYLDGGHVAESLSWMAGTAGTHLMADGTGIVFGSQDLQGTDITDIALDGLEGRTVTAYGSLIGTGDSLLTHRIHSVADTGLSVSMQGQENSPNTGNEARSFDYVVVENGGVLTQGGVNDVAARWKAVDDATNQAVFADMQSYNGTDTANLRTMSHQDQTWLKLAEEQSQDLELNHIAEQVASMSIARGSYELYENIEDLRSNDTVVASALEVGTLSLHRDRGSDGWVQVTFSTDIKDAVVVLGPVSTNGIDPVTPELRNVTDSGFEIRLSEWEALDGGHITETLSWMAGTAGQHMLDDGTKITFGTQNVSGSQPAHISYDGFDGTPVILGAVSGEGGDIVSHRFANVQENGAQIRLAAQEAQNGADSTTNRVVQWAAIEDGSGTLLQSGTQQINSVGSNIGQQDGALFADVQSYIGGDTLTLRSAPANDGTRLYLDEERSGDAETWHINETVSWLSIEAGRYDLFSTESALDLEAQIDAQVASLLADDPDLFSF